MKYLAMLWPIKLAPLRAYIVIDTDSQMCSILFRHIENTGIPPGGGRTMEPRLRTALDQRLVGFKKANGDSGDEWNNKADALAVRGRDTQAKHVMVNLSVRAVVGR
jgi:ribonuclease HI